MSLNAAESAVRALNAKPAGRNAAEVDSQDLQAQDGRTSTATVLVDYQDRAVRLLDNHGLTTADADAIESTVDVTPFVIARELDDGVDTNVTGEINEFTKTQGASEQTVFNYDGWTKMTCRCKNMELAAVMPVVAKDLVFPIRTAEWLAEREMQQAADTKLGGAVEPPTCHHQRGRP